MKNIRYFLVLAFASGVLFSCTKGSSRVSGLIGRWNITDYKRVTIYYDGSTDTTVNDKNNGYFEFVRYLDSEYIFNLTFSINTGGGLSQGSANGEITEDGNRLIIYGGTCIGCDLSYTIEQWGGGGMRLSQYAPVSQDSATYKLQIDLIKQ